MILLFFLYRACYSERDDVRYYIFQEIFQDKTLAAATGQVERVALRQNQENGISTSIYLKNCEVRLSGQPETVYFLKRLLVYQDGENHFEPGNKLQISGSLKEFLPATNPGQFDQKEYYKEKGIYYQFQAKEILVASTNCIWWKSVLYHFRDRMAGVYQECLPQKEGGIVTAMILGDKSLLDLDMKTLYQESGIGHLLAISGLHVTILGMAFYQLLKRLGVPVKCAVPVTLLVLLCYGCMTDYSISTSRAVIMMILLLTAEWIGRTYDRKSALAFSGIWIILQKPFALFSCSFLLSFGAIAGMEILLPAFQFLVYGDEETRREKRRRNQRRNRELQANCRFGNRMAGSFYLPEKIISMFLASLSVQMMLLPVMLYFFFEVPAYGILINLFVIPVAFFVVLLSFIGGVAGCVVLPLGKIVLGSVYGLLQFYEWICRFFQRLPGHMQILGRPAWWKILLYYGVLFLFTGVVWVIKKKEIFHKVSPWFLMGICSLVLVFVPFSARQFQMTMLDVGQGDAIFLHSAAGQNILLDGGSTSVSKVGTYRILPFLKCSGVRTVDYMILTHGDEDHVNGLLEVLRESGEGGPVVKQLAVPDISDQEEGNRPIIALAQKKGIPVVYLSEGVAMQSGELSLTCLNPVKNFQAESANAGSITISLQYKKFSCLLTGDLEGEGEEHVRTLLECARGKYRLPASYTMLKVAHHGSKNSTSQEFLELVQPSLALISCGRKNRYGHPHPELMKRLEDTQCKIFRTDQTGAVYICVKRDKIILTTYH